MPCCSFRMIFLCLIIKYSKIRVLVTGRQIQNCDNETRTIDTHSIWPMVLSTILFEWSVFNSLLSDFPLTSHVQCTWKCCASLNIYNQSLILIYDFRKGPFTTSKEILTNHGKLHFKQFNQKCIFTYFGARVILIRFPSFFGVISN